MHPRKQRRAEIEVERAALHAQMHVLQEQISALRNQDGMLAAEHQALQPLRGDALTLLRDLRLDPIAGSKIDAKRCYRAGLNEITHKGLAVWQRAGSGSRVHITQKGIQQLKLDEEEEKDTSP